MQVSFIIPTYNRRELLRHTLPTIFKQDFPNHEYEVVVVVDGSTDGTSAMLRNLQPRCGFQVLEQSNQGPAAARNNGLAAAQGQVVLFLDDDILCEPQVLGEHLLGHSGSEPAVVHGPIYAAPESHQTLPAEIRADWFKAFYGRLSATGGLNLPQDVHVVSNSSMPRSLLLDCGGFDVSMPFPREDSELGLRLWKRGIPFRYRSKAVVREIYSKSSRYFVRNEAPAMGRAEVILCRKHPDFRPHSDLSPLGSGPSWRRFLRQLAVRSPASPHLLLSPPRWIAERLGRIPPIRRLAIRLLWLQYRIVLLRSALREAGSWKALQADLGARLPVLMYHHVGQPQPGVPRSLTVSQEQFEGQIRWLARRGYVGICPADWLAWCREGKPLPPRPVLLTFDDGYADLLKHAVPVLKRYGFGAAVFVVSGQIGGTNIWDGAQPVPFGRLLAADEIRELAALGIEIGAHSHSHPDLRALSEEELGEEVAGSARDLGVICNRQILSFAYPYGHHDGRVRDRVRATYDLAYTTEEGMNTLLTDHQGLRRTMVQPSDRLIDFACRVWWGWNPLHWVRQRVSRGPG